MGRLFAIIQVGSICHHKCPYKKKTKGDLTEIEEEEAIHIARGRDCRDAPQAKECRQLPESGRGKL